MSLCVSLVISCELNISKNCEQIRMRLFEEVGHSPGTNRLDFGDDPGLGYHNLLFRICAFVRWIWQQRPHFLTSSLTLAAYLSVEEC